MKVTGIIAEYNPFHRGHAYQIQRARQITEADYIVIVMSGCFTQRGTPALLDKYDRARMALSGGADLVLELPVRYACASAEAFAGGAVWILNQLHCVDYLCFGSETGDTSALLRSADLLHAAQEQPAYREALKKGMKNGLSFPAARAQALEAFTENASPLPATPNDILGLEYCRALRRSHSSIRPAAVPRRGAGYHDETLQGREGFSSASAIRHALQESGCLQDIREELPEQTLPLWEEALREGGPVWEEDFFPLLAYRLLMLGETQEPGVFSCFSDVSPELSEKLCRSLYTLSGWQDTCRKLKSRDLAYTRINRCLTHILLDLRSEALEEARQTGFPGYLRILGFSEAARPLLTLIGKQTASPLITRPAEAQKVLPPDGLSVFREEIRASHIYQSVKAGKYGKPFRNEYQRPFLAV